MDSQRKQYDIQELLIRFLENELDDSQRIRLLEWSRNDSKAAQEYCDFIKDYVIIARGISDQIDPKYGNSDDTKFDHALWCALLDDQKSAPEIELPKEIPHRELIQKVIYPPQEKRKMSMFSIFFLAMNAAAILFIALFLRFTSDHSSPLAQVTGQVDAQWMSEGGQITVGSQLYSGPFILRTGIAEITLNSGAKVLLEAPVEIDLEAPSLLYLAKGRLVVDIKQAAENRFVVRTASSTIVDFGTKFGVEVELSGQINTHVFDGEVEMREGPDPLKYDHKLSLKSGQSGIATSLGRIALAEIGSARFISRMPSAFEYAVMKTKPLYYWQFDGDQNVSSQDQMSPGLKMQPQLYGSVSYTQGVPFHGNHSNLALKLTGHSEDYAILRPYDPQVDDSNPFSISIWVRPENLTAGQESVILHVRKEDGLGLGNRSTLTFIDNMFRFTVKSEGSQAISVASSPVTLNAWHHVVVSYEKNNELRMYTDGQLESQQIIPEKQESLKTVIGDAYWCLGSGVLSHSYSQNTKSGDRGSFAGLVDEICQYNRVLSAHEVRMLYTSAAANLND